MTIGVTMRRTTTTAQLTVAWRRRGGTQPVVGKRRTFAIGSSSSISLTEEIPRGQVDIPVAHRERLNALSAREAQLRQLLDGGLAESGSTGRRSARWLLRLHSGNWRRLALGALLRRSDRSSVRRGCRWQGAG